ncbi:MAG: B12-binding domain-containing radical SAM protein [Candidatus Hodarchaeota archaeon]
MKILLVAPKAWKYFGIAAEPLPPLGLAYLSAVLKERGDKVKILDNYVCEYHNVEHVINSFKPDVVGISINSITARHGYEIAKIAKEKEIITIVGGPHATLMPEKAVSNDNIDHVVVGEGEITLKKLLNNIENGNNERIKGVYYKNGKFLPREFIKDLDTLPYPDWDTLNLNNYPRESFFTKSKLKPLDTVNTSRGCPFNCTFCSVGSVSGKIHRAFSPRRMVEEILLLKEKYKSKIIFFREDNFTANRKRIENFCNLMIEEKIDISWMCESRVDALNKDLLIEMRKAGCETIFFGIESGSQKMLDCINKGIKVEQIEKIMKLCKKIGIGTTASFLIGVPGETYQTVRETVRFIIKIDPDVFWFNVYRPTPNSILYNEILDKSWYEHYDEFTGLCLVKTSNFDFNTVKMWEKKAWRGEILNTKYWRFKLKRLGFRIFKELIDALRYKIIDMFMNNERPTCDI